MKQKTYVLADQTPTGGKPMGGLRHFGLGRLLAQELPGLGRNQKNANCRSKGSRNGRETLPRYPGWLSATFLHFKFWPTGPPRAGNRKIRVL